MVYVKVDKEENFDQALKRFVGLLKGANLQEELYNRRFHIKKKEKRREAKKKRALTIKIANKNL